MKLSAPFQISSRLMPALNVGGAWLSLEIGDQTRSGRFRYEGWIDLPDGTEYPIEDLRSGVGTADLQSGFSSLLSFLGAAAESYRYSMHNGRPGENQDLFPPAVVEWAYGCSDELSMLQCEIDEASDPLITE